MAAERTVDELRAQLRIPERDQLHPERLEVALLPAPPVVEHHPDGRRRRRLLDLNAPRNKRLRLERGPLVRLREADRLLVDLGPERPALGRNGARRGLGEGEGEHGERGGRMWGWGVGDGRWER